MSDRRRFLKVASCSAGALALTAVVGCGGPNTGQAPASGPVAGGNVKDVPVGYLGFVPGSPVVLGRDAGGLYAMTAICTHQQCNMESDGSVSSNGLHCSCHDSSFDRNGVVTGGPARVALEHYRVDLASNGTITIQASIFAMAAARTSVP
jgi:cytochrome b6-f complex iron-sulfur subunit